MSSSPAIEIQQVTKTFGSQVAVNRLDLQVPSGSIYGFIGPNGSGKTTTLRMILRIYQPDEGRVTVLGQSSGKTADDRVGYLPEERGLYKRMKVNDLLTYYARLKGCYNCQGKIDRWLERLGAKDWAKKRIDALSKGMAQKVQFIASVVAEPQLLILDEPFSGLDPVNMEMLKDAILEVQKQGTTIIFSTHDMDTAERMCDTVFMIFKGNKVLDGSVDQIKNQFAKRQFEVRFDQPLQLQGRPEFTNVTQQGELLQFQLASLPNASHSLDSASQVLAYLQTLGSVNHFRSQRPTLHDIFVQIASA
ncbi:MAG: ATP-binding cassette domain-containing protein [Planctomycetaceae bacterium]|nr:ATP-binding cassette domain-containing protein [Planctomycetaceae bacterium]